MKRFKRGFALILGAAMAMSSAASLSADAIDFPGVAEFKGPDGYELMKMTTERAEYRCIDNHSSWYFYTNFWYNFAIFDVSDGELWAEIYEKYEAELAPDHYSASESQNNGEPVVCVQFYDLLDEGDTPDAADSIQDKTDVLEAAMREAFEAGILVDANYSALHVDRTHGQVEDQLRVSGYTGTADEMKAVVDEYNPEAAITLYQNSAGEDACAIKELTGNSTEELEALCAKIEETFAGCDANLVIVGTHAGFHDIGGTVDILFELKEEVSDIDSSGTVDITDAVMILQHYAESAVSGAAAASETNMDVNRDGSITIDDATEVLGIYAQNAAGVTES